jgi:hypothetical protein
MLTDGLFDTNHLTDARTELLCARLYLRAGKRRVKKGFRPHDMAAFYNSVFFGMRYYIVKHKQCEVFVKDHDLWDATSLFQALTRAGVFDDPLQFNRLSLAVERAIWQASFSFDSNAMLQEVEGILTKLGVLPYHSSTTLTPRANT